MRETLSGRHRSETWRIGRVGRERRTVDGRGGRADQPDEGGRKKSDKCQNRLYVFMMTLRLALIALVLVSYIHVQNDITMRLGHISSLERQVTELKKNNESMQKRLSATGNLTAIMDRSRKKFGMDYATKDQIVYYSLAKEDFVDQYHKVD